MNKLYKYLPFDITVKTINETVGILNGINNNGYIELISEEAQDTEYTIGQIKPILRPFEDLSKELPLTKAAAEMIGMKEGEVVYSFYIIRYLNNISNPMHKIKNYSCLTYYTQRVNKNNKLEFSILNNKFIIDNWVRDTGINRNNTYFSDCFYTEWCKIGYMRRSDKSQDSFVNETNDQEKYLDFLRAMKFAVDFSENEYIKLIS